MTKPRRLLGTTLLAASIIVGVTACSKPDANPPVVITGDPAKANPPIETTTTSTTAVPSTTLFYAQK